MQIKGESDATKLTVFKVLRRGDLALLANLVAQLAVHVNESFVENLDSLFAVDSTPPVCQHSV